MADRKHPAAALAVLLLAGAAAPAHAQSFKLVMQGALDSRSSLVSGGTTAPLADGSLFTLEAFFDTRGANLVSPLPFPGFVAYTPTLVSLTLGGRTYEMQPFDRANPTGVSVAVFDATTPFNPGRYGVGLIQNPLADGAGMVADFLGASPAFTIGSGGVVATTFTDFQGVGVSSGACTSGSPPACPHAVTPIPLTWAGQSFALSLGNYEDDLAPGGTPFTVSLVAVPEPSSLALLAGGVVGVAAVARRRSRRP